MVTGTCDPKGCTALATASLTVALGAQTALSLFIQKKSLSLVLVRKVRRKQISVNDVNTTAVHCKQRCPSDWTIVFDCNLLMEGR